MKARFSSIARRGVFLLIVLALLFTFNFPQSVSAAGVTPSSHPSSADKKTDPEFPLSEPTPTPSVEETSSASFDPKSVSITLIFKTIIEWLMGKNLTEVFEDVNLTNEQRAQIESLTGESNPLNLATNFCTQVRSGDFSRMAESVRESNRDDGSGNLSPSILMDFFEQLGAFCPDAAVEDVSLQPIE